MLTFEFLPAKHGDCILVRWGDPTRIMIVDGGPDGVYEGELKPRLTSLLPKKGDSRVVDVLCLSHIDEDHVVGVERMLKELVRARREQLPPPFVVRRVWFNSLDDLIDATQLGLSAPVRQMMQAAQPDAVVSASYGQGDSVRSSVAALGLAGNQPFGGLLKVGSAKSLWDLDVKVVGPNSEALAQLAKEWADSVQNKDSKAIAAAFTDRKVQNLTSIALHLRHGGHTALLTGDARGDQILAALESVKLLDPGGTIDVDVFKLPHHGSEKNADQLMFKRIRANHYVVSANGKNKRPSLSTLSWLIESRAYSDKFTIHFTNHIPDVEEMLTEKVKGRSFTVKIGAPRVEITF
jgi:hypothetical protein